MALAFKKGDTVRQVVPAPIEGTVAAFSVDQETGAVQVLVEYPHAEDGSTSSRYFDAGELEAVAVPAVDAPAAE
mgnify:CR=1 FL=1